MLSPSYGVNVGHRIEDLHHCAACGLYFVEEDPYNLHLKMHLNETDFTDSFSNECILSPSEFALPEHQSNREEEKQSEGLSQGSCTIENIQEKKPDKSTAS